MNLPVYLDYNATTPVDPRVLEAMLPFFTEAFGNASSSHAFGSAALAAAARARESLAARLGVQPEDILFTSGATEADNLALFGATHGLRSKGDHIVTQATEHPAVLEACRELEREGFTVTVLPVDGHGRVDPDLVGKAITARTILVSIMHANNELGTLQPIESIARTCRERGVAFHTDAAQSLGKVPLSLQEVPADLAAVTAHKLYGPKGIGALIARGEVLRHKLRPVHHGGGQELGLRPGTLNVPGIVGLAKAVEVAVEELPEEGPRLRELRLRLLTGLREHFEEVRVNGHPEHHLPGTLHVSLKGVDANHLLHRVPEVAASTGSACHSGGGHLSGVLAAVGMAPEWAVGSIRLAIGRFTTEEEVDFAAKKLGMTARDLAGRAQ
jgi:cysteine desulfurase